MSEEPHLYRIGEVSAMLGLKTSVLRFWESEFPGLESEHSVRGQRLYTEQNVVLLRRIKSLVHDQGMTIEGARRVLAEDEKSSSVGEEKCSCKGATGAFLSEIAEELRDIRRRLLGLPSSSASAKACSYSSFMSPSHLERELSPSLDSAPESLENSQEASASSSHGGQTSSWESDVVSGNKEESGMEAAFASDAPQPPFAGRLPSGDCVRARSNDDFQEGSSVGSLDGALKPPAYLFGPAPEGKVLLGELLAKENPPAYLFGPMPKADVLRAQALDAFFEEKAPAPFLFGPWLLKKQ